MADDEVEGENILHLKEEIDHDIDPISLVPLSELLYPPFVLRTSLLDTHTVDNPKLDRFDGKILAEYVTATGCFQNPLSRRPLTIDECNELDRYLAVYGLPRFDVARAYRESGAEHTVDGNTVDSSRRRQEANQVLFSLFRRRSDDPGSSRERAVGHRPEPRNPLSSASTGVRGVWRGQRAQISRQYRLDGDDFPSLPSTHTARGDVGTDVAWPLRGELHIVDVNEGERVISHSASSATWAAGSRSPPSALKELTLMGFDGMKALAALQASEGDVSAAIDWILAEDARSRSATRSGSAAATSAEMCGSEQSGGAWPFARRANSPASGSVILMADIVGSNGSLGRAQSAAAPRPCSHSDASLVVQDVVSPAAGGATDGVEHIEGACKGDEQAMKDERAGLVVAAMLEALVTRVVQRHTHLTYELPRLRLFRICEEQLGTPVLVVEHICGPDHLPIFEARISVGAITLAVGWAGPKKRDAVLEAVTLALCWLEDEAAAVTAIRLRVGADTSAGSATDPGDSVTLSPVGIAENADTKDFDQLTQMGFAARLAACALRKTSSLEAALEWLLEHNDGDAADVSDTGRCGAEESLRLGEPGLGKPANPATVTSSARASSSTPASRAGWELDRTASTVLGFRGLVGLPAGLKLHNVLRISRRAYRVLSVTSSETLVEFSRFEDALLILERFGRSACSNRFRCVQLESPSLTVDAPLRDRHKRLATSKARNEASPSSHNPFSTFGSMASDTTDDSDSDSD